MKKRKKKKMKGAKKRKSWVVTVREAEALRGRR